MNKPGYAKKILDIVLEAKRRVEDKADGILRILMAIVGILIAAVKLSPTAPPFPVIVICLAAVAISAMLAIFVIRPNPWGLPMSIQDALENTGQEKQMQQIRLAASMHVSCVAAIVELERKSKLLCCSQAILLLSIIFIGAAWLWR